MKTIIKKYVGRTIAVNHEEPKKFRTVVLTDVTDSYFSIQVGKAIVHFNLDSIIYIAESTSGLKAVRGTPFSFSRQTVPLIIQVRPLVVGGVGGGVGVGVIF